PSIEGGESPSLSSSPPPPASRFNGAALNRGRRGLAGRDGRRARLKRFNGAALNRGRRVRLGRDGEAVDRDAASTGPPSIEGGEVVTVELPHVGLTMLQRGRPQSRAERPVWSSAGPFTTPSLQRGRPQSRAERRKRHDQPQAHRPAST